MQRWGKIEPGIASASLLAFSDQQINVCNHNLYTACITSIPAATQLGVFHSERLPTSDQGVSYCVALVQSYLLVVHILVPHVPGNHIKNIRRYSFGIGGKFTSIFVLGQGNCCWQYLNNRTKER
jgi:hypothetical protein